MKWNLSLNPYILYFLLIFHLVPKILIIYLTQLIFLWRRAWMAFNFKMHADIWYKCATDFELDWILVIYASLHLLFLWRHSLKWLEQFLSYKHITGFYIQAHFLILFGSTTRKYNFLLPCHIHFSYASPQQLRSLVETVSAIAFIPAFTYVYFLLIISKQWVILRAMSRNRFLRGCLHGYLRK